MFTIFAFKVCYKLLGPLKSKSKHYEKIRSYPV